MHSYILFEPHRPLSYHSYYSINQLLLLLPTKKQTFQGTILSVTPPVSSTCFLWEQGASLSPDLSLRTRTPRHQRRCSWPAESWFHQVVQLCKKATFRCLRDHRQRPFIQPQPSTMRPETQHMLMQQINSNIIQEQSLVPWLRVTFALKNTLEL